MKDERGRGYREEMKKKKHRSVGEGGNKVTFGRLASACGRIVLRASGPGAGEARPAG